MNISSSVNWGLFENIDDSCGTTATNFPIKSKVAKINEALDWYFNLAEKSASNWSVDDLGNSSPPIDTQNIVSGTNRYKLSAFTEEIVEILRLEALDSDANGLQLIPETLDSFGNVLGNISGQLYQTIGTFEEAYLQAPSGIPTHYLKYGDFIYLRPNPNYSETSGLKIYFNRPASKFAFVSCQGEADDEKFTATAHGLSAGDTVIFEVNASGTLPTGLSADTEYYVIATDLTANVFKVSATSGGSAVNITTDGTNLAFLKTNKEPGIPSNHHPMLYRKASATFMEFGNTGGVYNSRLQTVLAQLQKDERAIERFYASRDRDLRKRLTPRFQDNH